MGDLADCRKIYFDERADIAPRWRIVYRLTPLIPRVSRSFPSVVAPTPTLI
jgi:hypothetical protein